MSGWWLGTCFIWSYIGNSAPNRLMFFKRGGSTTHQDVVWCLNCQLFAHHMPILLVSLVTKTEVCFMNWSVYSDRGDLSGEQESSSGWWFRTCVILPLGIVIPSDFHIVQMGGSTTNQYNCSIIYIYIYICIYNIYQHIYPHISTSQPCRGSKTATLLSASADGSCEGAAAWKRIPLMDWTWSPLTLPAPMRYGPTVTHLFTPEIPWHPLQNPDQTFTTPKVTSTGISVHLNSPSFFCNTACSTSALAKYPHFFLKRR